MKKGRLNWQHIVVALLAICVFCFWFFLFPFIPVAREMSVLFLWDTDYLMERIVIPGGMAQYVGECVAQFFLNPFNGAIIYAVLFVVAQLLSKKFFRCLFPVVKEHYLFVLSLIPPMVLWGLAMLPYVPLTPTVAVLMVMGAGWFCCSKFFDEGQQRGRSVQTAVKKRLLAVCVMIPVMYWLAGPAALLLTLCCVRWIPLTVSLFAVCLIGSSYLVPYPLGKIVKGIDYDWRGVKEMGTYEEMECDMLIRQQKWDRILQRFPSPVSPAVRSALILASYKSGKGGYQELMSKIVVPIERYESSPSVFCIGDMHFIVYFGSVSSAFMVSDMAGMLGWPSIAQRAAFEAMEYIPNYNKSGRALKRLTEVCIITGQYALARKYLSILENTTFYRGWAQEMRPLLDNPKLIDKYPFMKESREKYENTEDIFFI